VLITHDYRERRSSDCLPSIAEAFSLHGLHDLHGFSVPRGQHFFDAGCRDIKSMQVIQVVQASFRRSLQLLSLQSVLGDRPRVDAVVSQFIEDVSAHPRADQAADVARDALHRLSGMPFRQWPRSLLVRPHLL
jgi:hypothetical protein